MKNQNFKNPHIAKGDFLPPGISAEMMKQEKEKYLLKSQRRHDWLIAIFGVLGGGIMGFITSLVFWLIAE